MDKPRYIDANKIKLLDSLSWKDENGDLLVSLRDVRNAIAKTPTEEVVAVPCKVGDTVYQTDGVRIYSLDIVGIIGVIYDTESIAFDSSVIGKSIYLTREEAEKALKYEQKHHST